MNARRKECLDRSMKWWFKAQRAGNARSRFQSKCIDRMDFWAKEAIRSTEHTERLNALAIKYGLTIG